MKMIVVVEEEKAYNQWKQQQESWLMQNPDYMKKVPAALQEAAMIKAGLQRDPGIGVADND
jgi:cytochrome c oxidase subunit 2